MATSNGCCATPSGAAAARRSDTMVFFMHSGRCSRPGARRATVAASAIAAATGGLVSSLLKDGWVSDDPGVDNTWHIASMAICGLVIVGGVVVLLVQWRRRQER